MAKALPRMEILAIRTNLSSLDTNPIGMEGTVMMMRYLPRLSWLSCGSNPMGNEGAYSIAINLALLHTLFIRNVCCKSRGRRSNRKGMHGHLPEFDATGEVCL